MKILLLPRKNKKAEIPNWDFCFLSGGKRTRTDDPRVANAMLYQLSYTPLKLNSTNRENRKSSLNQDFIILAYFQNLSSTRSLKISKFLPKVFRISFLFSLDSFKIPVPRKLFPPHLAIYLPLYSRPPVLRLSPPKESPPFKHAAYSFLIKKPFGGNTSPNGLSKSKFMWRFPQSAFQ